MIMQTDDKQIFHNWDDNMAKLARSCKSWVSLAARGCACIDSGRRSQGPKWREIITTRNSAS